MNNWAQAVLDPVLFMLNIIQICQLLKDYIGSRHLYDPDDPRVVYCGKDPLGKVFSVEKFTIEEVL